MGGAGGLARPSRNAANVAAAMALGRVSRPIGDGTFTVCEGLPAGAAQPGALHAPVLLAWIAGTTR